MNLSFQIALVRRSPASTHNIVGHIWFDFMSYACMRLCVSGFARVWCPPQAMPMYVLHGIYRRLCMCCRYEWKASVFFLFPLVRARVLKANPDRLPLAVCVFVLWWKEGKKRKRRRERLKSNEKLKKKKKKLIVQIEYNDTLWIALYDFRCSGEWREKRTKSTTREPEHNSKDDERTERSKNCSNMY